MFALTQNILKITVGLGVGVWVRCRCLVVCVVCCVLLLLWLWMWLCVCVSSCLALKNASESTFKTLPCVRSKRPRHIGRGRFEGTHGSVFERTHGRVSPRLLSLVSFCHSPLMCLSSLIRLSFSLSLTDLNNNDNDRSSSWLSLYTRPYVA